MNNNDLFQFNYSIQEEIYLKELDELEFAPINKNILCSLKSCYKDIKIKNKTYQTLGSSKRCFKCKGTGLLNYRKSISFPVFGEILSSFESQNCTFCKGKGII